MEAYRKMLKSKIHRATVTHADLQYEGSISLSPELLEAAGLYEYEAVNIWNISAGTRFETYTIEGEKGTSNISINGAAARLVSPGDLIIIASFALIREPVDSMFVPTVVFVDERNHVKQIRKEVPGPKMA